MCKKEIVINGNNFNGIEQFYIEIAKKLSKDLTWNTCHNLDVFSDLLRGGFGIHEYGEPITILWENSSKSKSDLGFNATVQYYKNILMECHISNIDNIKSLLENAENEKGDTLFDIIIETIKEHNHIELILK